MAEHVGLRDADPASVTDGLRRLARAEAASVDTISWVNACAKSGLCVASCPKKSKGLDAIRGLVSLTVTSIIYWLAQRKMKSRVP
jgi:ferredoxin